MPELTDDQLDGLFRKSAEEFDPPFDPAAWRDMKTRLDANDRNPAGGSLIVKNLLRWGLPLVLLVLLSGGGWYAYRRTRSAAVHTDLRKKSIPGSTLNQKAKLVRPITDIPTTSHKPVRTTPVDPKEGEAHAAKQPTDLVASVAEPARSGKHLSNAATASGSDVTPDSEVATNGPTLAYRPKMGRDRLHRPASFGNAALGKKNVPELTHGTRSVNRPKNRVARNGSGITTNRYRVPLTRMDWTSVEAGPVRKRRSTTNQTLFLKNTVTRTDSITQTSEDKIGSVALPTLIALTARSATWPKLSSLSIRPVTVPPDTTVRRVVSSHTLRGLSIRAVAAPDLSTMGLKNFSRPGTTVGLLLEYRLSARWSIQAGVMQSTKLYRALPDEYSAPEGAWGGPVKPLNIDGRCNLLDIPLNLRYDFRIRPQRNEQLESRWFVSGGVTSYIMERENYVYNYPAHTYRQITDSSVNTGTYGLSHINLSVGYERALSRRLSWQVEPFIKMPLRRVGYFSTDLFSTGVFLSIRYKL